MSKRRKIFLTLILLAALGVATISGLAFYYYSNPSKLKHLAENAISGFTGTECSIREIALSQKPLSVRIKGIQLIEQRRGSYLEIPEISAVLSTQGRLGRRILIFENLQVNGFTLRAAEAWGLPRIASDAGKVPFLRRVIGGLFSFFVFKEIRVHEAGLIDGRMTGRWGDHTINVHGLYANLTPERFLEAGCGVRIRSIPDGTDLQVPRLKLVADRPIYPLGATIQATLTGEGVDFEAPRGKVSSATLETKMLYRRQEKTLEFESFTIASDAAAVHAENGSPFPPFPFLVEARAGLDLQKAKLTAPSVHVALGDFADLKGEFHADFTGNQEFIIKVGELETAPEKILPMLPDSMKGYFEGVGFVGPIVAVGLVTGSMDQHFGQWACDLEARLRENKISFSSAGALFHTTLAGDVVLRGPLSDLEIRMNMSGEGSRARIGAVEIEKGRFSLDIAGAYPAFRVNHLSMHTAAARWMTGGREFLLEDIEGRARSGSFDVKTKSMRLPELALATSTLKNLLLSMEMTEELFSLAAKGEEIHLAEFGRAMGLLPQGWEIKAADSLQGRALIGKEGRLTLSAKLRIQGLSFESEDGDFVGENISLVLEPSLEGKIGPHGKLSGAVSVSVGEGEILYDRFYLDLNRHALALTGKGSCELAAGFLDVADFGLHLENLATLNVKGTLALGRDENSRLLVHAPRAPLAPIFRQFIVEPYKHQNPSLTDLHLDGFFSLDLELSGKDTLWTVKGRSRWQEGQAATEGQGILLKGIELDLPIWHHHDTKGALEKTALRENPVEIEGSLFIQSARLPLLPAQPISTLLKAGPDRLRTLSPIGVMTAGGQIEVGRILFKEPFSGEPKIETALTLKEIDLKPWLSNIWPEPVGGAAKGKLDPVRWQGGVLTTEGEVAADLFGGQLIISNLGAKRFPSLTPVITLDAAWSDLNLAQITADTAFGEIQGNLRGHAKGLEIADGQPQAFDLFMETVKQRDIPQRISVQAVDNIAQLGGGASPFRGLAGAFVSFFRELPYEKIGISAVLENDVFRINGTIRENDKQYLIKKGGFSGVDVIIASSESNTISFKDMVRRIKRVADSKEGPVIE